MYLNQISMNKRKFTILEKFAVWKGHEKKCYICGEPINFKETTIDHIIPEKCLTDKDEYKKFKEYFRFDDDFNINGFENWMPAHPKCNSEKGDRFYPSTDIVLKKARAKACSIKKEVEKLIREQESNKILATLLGWIENEQITIHELSLAFEIFNLPYAVNLEKIDRDELAYVPSGWRATSREDRAGMIFVELHDRGGFVPKVSNPDAHEWECQRCHNYGPWNGTKCLSCGAYSDIHLE